jgi:hypothetical protein
MPANGGQRRQRRIDPLITGIGDGVAAGYRAVESVVAGANESVRMRPSAAAAAAGRRSTRRSGSAATGARSPGGRPKAPGRTTADRPPPTLMGEIADVAAEVLDGLGEAVREIAGHLAERDRFEDAALHHAVELSGAPGDTASDAFLLTNTGQTALKGLTFDQTNLIGATGYTIRRAAVTLTPTPRGRSGTNRVAPAGSTTVAVAVKIPAGAPAGMYRGIVCAQFGEDADRTDGADGPWTLIELEVLDAAPGAR